MKQATLCFLVKNHSLSLGIKKRKLGKGKYNGFGGNLEPNESIEQAAIRELYEEVRVRAKTLEKVAEITYQFPDNKTLDQTVHVYLVTQWEGEPEETEEMGFEWFDVDKIPYEKMWDNDKHWLPLVLEGKKLKGSVIHNEQSTASYTFEEIKGF